MCTPSPPTAFPKEDFRKLIRFDQFSGTIFIDLNLINCETNVKWLESTSTLEFYIQAFTDYGINKN